jgi:CubicO group peptidase (beta-lactamase class C family)
MPSTATRLRELVNTGVHDNVYPGAVWATGDAAGIIARGATGVLDPARTDEPMGPDTVFDVASLTKILAVWTTIGTLWQDRDLDLDEPLGRFWLDVAGYPLGHVTARQLLTHTPG